MSSKFKKINEGRNIVQLCSHWMTVQFWGRKYASLPLFTIIPSVSTKLKEGYTGFTSSVRLSVCPPVDKILSALYLPQYFFEFLPIIFKFYNLNLLWDGIWYESMVWVIIGRWGYSQNADVLVVLVVLRSELLPEPFSMSPPAKTFSEC